MGTLIYLGSPALIIDIIGILELRLESINVIIITIIIIIRIFSKLKKKESNISVKSIQKKQYKTKVLS